MNRESEQHFTMLPEIHVPRSKFVKPHSHTTTFNAAYLVPVFVDSDIIPGTTVNMKMASVVRMQTPMYPTFGNCFLDVFWFFIPHRLVWEHWREFWGESNNPWYPTTTYTVPQIKTPANSGGAAAKSVWDYMGLPTGVEGLSVSALPFRAYAKVYNDFFRSNPIEYAAAFSMVDNDMNYGSAAYTGGTLLKANKFHDYFTSALPGLQYGAQTVLPLGGVAPVYSTTTDHTTFPTDADMLRFTILGTGTNEYGNGYHNILGYTASPGNDLKVIGDKATASAPSADKYLQPKNLWADLGSSTVITLNVLREAVGVAHYLEARARTGGRYVEFLKGIYGVTPSDASLQRAEYLGGKRIPINIFSQVQTSETGSTSPLGTVGAFSHTADSNDYFTKSFDDFGTLLGIACVRYDHVYQQGIDRMWSRKTPYQFYLPQLNGLSEQSILNKEIYAQGNSYDDQVFGYQEMYAEYRYANNKVSAEMRSNYTTSLDAWHYADDYATMPVLGTTWLQENEMTLNRTLAVPSTTADQFLADFYFKPTYVMPMPIYSVPGLETL